MGKFAELFMEELIRQSEQPEPPRKETPQGHPWVYPGPTPTPEQVEQTLSTSEAMLTEISRAPYFNPMKFRAVTRHTTHTDRVIALMQLSPRDEQFAVLTPFYGRYPERLHFGVSTQVDLREASVRVLRTNDRNRLVTQGDPYSIEDFNTNPTLIIPSIAGAVLETLAKMSRRKDAILRKRDVLV